MVGGVGGGWWGEGVCVGRRRLDIERQFVAEAVCEPYARLRFLLSVLSFILFTWYITLLCFLAFLWFNRRVKYISTPVFGIFLWFILLA